MLNGFTVQAMQTVRFAKLGDPVKPARQEANSEGSLPPPGTGIVRGQAVAREKQKRARALRRDTTPEEATLWHYLRNNRLGGWPFRRQQVIDGFIADFFCARAWLVVEVDGAVHQEHAAYDAARDQVLTARGLRVLRVSNDDVRANMPAVLQRIRVACTLPPGEAVDLDVGPAAPSASRTTSARQRPYPSDMPSAPDRGAPPSYGDPKAPLS